MRVEWKPDFLLFFLLLSSLLHFLNLFWPKHIHWTNPVTLAMQKCIILFTVSLSLSTLVAQEHGLPVPGWFGLKDSLHHLPICLSIYLYVYLPTYLSIYLSSYLSIDLSMATLVSICCCKGCRLKWCEATSGPITLHFSPFLRISLRACRWPR